MKAKLLVAAVIMSGSMVVAAQATPITLYQDTFFNSGSAAVLLSAHPLDTTTGLYGATAGASWTSRSNWNVGVMTSRASISNTSAANEQAWLPFTPQTGNVYTLSAKMYVYPGFYDTTGMTSQYLGLGFAGTSGIPSTSGNFYSVASDWVDINPYGNYTRVGYASSTTTGWASSGVTYNTSLITKDAWHTFAITLDTTGSHWTSTYSVDGTQYGSVTYATNPTISAVGFGGYVGNAAGPNVTNFILAASPVPEPGTLALLAAGLVGLIAYAWRKR